jgi:hypothetical protein
MPYTLIRLTQSVSQSTTRTHEREDLGAWVNKRGTHHVRVSATKIATALTWSAEAFIPGIKGTYDPALSLRTAPYTRFQLVHHMRVLGTMPARVSVSRPQPTDKP